MFGHDISWLASRRYYSDFFSVGRFRLHGTILVEQGGGSENYSSRPYAMLPHLSFADDMYGQGVGVVGHS